MLTQVHAVLAHYSLLDIDRLSDARNVRVTCPNPDHEDARPSCSVDVITGKFYCFSCGFKGHDSIQFIQAIEEKTGNPIDEWAAMNTFSRIRLLKKTDTLDVPYQPQERKKENTRAIKKAKDFFDSIPKTNWEIIQSHYMQDERHFSNKILSKFDIRNNYSSYFPIVIPIYMQSDFNLKFVGYIERKAKKCEKCETKYLNNPQFSKTTTVGGALRKGPILLTEGFLNKMMAHQFGYSNVACIFGWHISDIQAQFIRQFATEIICGFDNDRAGRDGVTRARTVFSDIPVRALQFGQYENDICEMESARFVWNMEFAS